MNRILAYSDRNRKELLRDPLSYVFCLAFPLVMLVVMTLVDTSIPRESGMTVFHIQNLCAGIAVFGQLRRFRLDDHALGRLCAAGGQRPRAALGLHHAETAGAEIVHILQIAEAGNVDPV